MTTQENVTSSHRQMPRTFASGFSLLGLAHLFSVDNAACGAAASSDPLSPLRAFRTLSVMPVFGVLVAYAAVIDVPAVPAMVLVIVALMAPVVLVLYHDRVVVVVMPLACTEEHAADKHRGKPYGDQKNGMRGGFHGLDSSGPWLNLATGKIVVCAMRRFNRLSMGAAQFR